MRFPFPKTALAVLFAAALGARADIPPGDDEHLVLNTFGVANADADSSKVIVACEFYPGSAAPVAAYRLHDQTRSGILHYKFDRVMLYWAKAADWEMLHGRQGIHDGPPTGAAGDADRSGWKAQGVGREGDWLVGGARLSRIAGDIEAGQSFVDNSNPLASEERIYSLSGLDQGGSAELARKISNYSDGRKPVLTEYPLHGSGIDDMTPARGQAFVSLSRAGWRLTLASNRWGVAAIALYDADGARIWASHRVLAAGMGQDLALPRLASGRYFLSVDGPGWRQSFPLRF